MGWNAGAHDLIRDTSQYLDVPADEDNRLLDQWKNVVEGCVRSWEAILNVGSLVGQPLDDLEQRERQFLLGDDELHDGGHLVNLEEFVNDE